MEIKDKVIQIVKEILGVEEVKEESHLVNDLKADELKIVEIVLEVEVVFTVEISDGKLEELNTVADIIKCVEELTNSKKEEE